MFGLKRRLLAVSLLAALGIAGAIGVSGSDLLLSDERRLHEHRLRECV